MELKEKVFAAADRLALRLGGVDQVTLRLVRQESGAKNSRVAGHLREWRDARVNLGADALPGLLSAADELVQRIFVLGAIVGIGHAGKAAPDHITDVSTAVRISGGEADQPGGAEQGFLAFAREPRKKNSAGAAEREQSAEVPTERGQRVKKVDWQLAANPKFAEKACKALRQIGYPLLSLALQDAAKMSLGKRDKAYREVRAALAGSNLIRKDGKWWFADEERPAKPKRLWKPRRTHLAQRRKQSERLRDGIFAQMRDTGKIYSVRELLDFMNESLDPPKSGEFGFDWLSQILKRAAHSHPNIVKQGPRYRWMARPGARRKK